MSFPRFNFLPIEIRNMIWQDASSEPRIVVLQPRRVKWMQYECTRVRSDIFVEGSSNWDFFLYGDVEGERDTDSGWPDPFGYWSPAVRPAVLTVCRDSFDVASKVYQRCFGTNFASPDIWFNFEVDTLNIKGFTTRSNSRREDPAEYRHLIRSDSSKIKNVSFESSDIPHPRTIACILLELTLIFQGAHNYTIIDHCHMPIESGDLEFMDLLDVNASLNLFWADKTPHFPDEYAQLCNRNLAFRALKASDHPGPEEYPKGYRVWCRTYKDKLLKFGRKPLEVPRIWRQMITTRTWKTQFDKAHPVYLRRRKYTKARAKFASLSSDPKNT